MSRPRANREKRFEDILNNAFNLALAQEEGSQLKKEQLILDAAIDLANEGFPKNKIKSALAKKLIDKKTGINQNTIRRALKSEEFANFRDQHQLKVAESRKRNKQQRESPSGGRVTTTQAQNGGRTTTTNTLPPIMVGVDIPTGSLSEPTIDPNEEQPSQSVINKEIQSAAFIQRLRWMNYLLAELTGMQEADRTEFFKSLPKGKIPNMELAERARDQMFYMAKKMSDSQLNTILSLAQIFTHLWPKYEEVLYNEMMQRKNTKIMA
jgi:hypothetical protein